MTTVQKKNNNKKNNKKNIVVNNTKVKSDEYRLNSSDDSADEENEINNELPSDRSTLNTPWIEKYRPELVDDLVIDTGTLNKIKKIISEKNMPNIIITGVPGIGKTTTILCIAKNLLGKYFDEGVLN